MNQTITVSDADRAIDYTLEVTYEFRPGTPARMGWGGAGDPGEAPRVEISKVECMSFRVWHGRHAEEVIPEYARQVGAYCWDQFGEEIEAELLKGMGVEA